MEPDGFRDTVAIRSLPYTEFLSHRGRWDNPECLVRRERRKEERIMPAYSLGLLALVIAAALTMWFQNKSVKKSWTPLVVAVGFGVIAIASYAFNISWLEFIAAGAGLGIALTVAMDLQSD